MKNNKKVFRSNIGIIIFDGLITVIAITVLLVLVYEFAAYNFIVYILYNRREVYFICLAVGVLISIIIQLFRFTRVSIEKKGFFKYVVIKRLFKKQYYGLFENYFSERTHSAKHNAFTINKRYIIIMNRNKKHDVKRLYGFSAKAFYELINEIHNAQIEQIPGKYKDDMIQDSSKSSSKLELPVENIIRLEWKSVRFNSFIFIAATLAIGIIVFFLGDEYANVKYLALLIASVLCVMEIPIEIIKTKMNIKRCPEFIEAAGEHLIIGEHYFVVSDIEKITLTSLDCKSSSIYPVQRYMTIKTDAQKYKFWLGSENSGINDEYKIIYGFIRCAFINEPSKFEVSGKRSWF